MSTADIDLIRGIDRRVQQGIEHAQQQQFLTPAVVKSVSYGGANVQFEGSAKVRRNIPIIEGMELVEGERVLLARAGRMGYVVVGASAAKTPARDAIPVGYTGPPLVGLEDNAGVSIDPDPSDRRIQFTDDGIINADKSGNTMQLSVAVGQIDHDALNNYVAAEHLALPATIAAVLTDHNKAAHDALGIDADTLDTYHAAAFPRKAENAVITGAWDFQATIDAYHVLPAATDTYDLGSSTKLWRKGYLSELEAVLFVENSVSLVGGWMMIPHDSGTLAEDVNNSQTTIDFGKAMTQNDFVLMRAIGQVEYIQVGTLVGGTTYNVTRNLDGSGANSWAQGTPFAVLGNTGNGRIELNAQSQGPMIQLMEQGATYNAQTERIRIGDLNGWGGYSSQVFGLAVGDWSGNKYLTYEATNGLRVHGNIYADTGTLVTLSVTGTLTLSGSGKMVTAASGPRIEITTTEIAGYNASTWQFKLQASDGKAYAGGGDVWLDSAGVNIEADSSNYVQWKSGGASVAYITASASSLQITTKNTGFSQTGILDAETNTSNWAKSMLQARSGTTIHQFYVTVKESTGAAYAVCGPDLRCGAGLTIGSYSYDPAVGELRIYNGSTWIGQLSYSDTTWFRINQGVAKNIYTPRFIRADGGLVAGGATPAAGEVVSTSYMRSGANKHAMFGLSAPKALTVLGTNYRLTWATQWDNVGSFTRSDSNRRVHVPEVGTYLLTVKTLNGHINTPGVTDTQRIDTKIFIAGTQVYAGASSVHCQANGTTYWNTLTLSYPIVITNTSTQYIEVYCTWVSAGSSPSIGGWATSTTKWTTICLHRIN
jgi:hypothetical protein